jgi:MYXO-CTERM domain-containing protein
MPDALYQYGAAVFPFFLKDRFAGGDPAFLREVWESFKQDGTYSAGFGNCSEGNNPDWMQGLDALLKTKGSSLAEAFAEFAVWRAVVGRYNDGQHLKNAGYVPAPAVAVIFQGFPVRNYLLVRKWGTRYLEYVPASDSEGPLSITITGKLPASWIGSVVLWRQGQAVEVSPLTFDAKGVASLQTPFLAGIDRVLIAVSQVAGPEYRTDDMDYGSEQSFQYSVTQLAGQDAALPPGPDAAPAGPDAEPAGPDAAALAGLDATVGLDAATADAGVPEADSGTSEPVKESEGCGCGSASGASALLGLLGLGALLGRRSRR